MSPLAQLKLSPASRRTQLSPVARKRRKLLEQIDLQQKAADEEFFQEVRRWVRVEGSDARPKGQASEVAGLGPSALNYALALMPQDHADLIVTARPHSRSGHAIQLLMNDGHGHFVDQSDALPTQAKSDFPASGHPDEWLKRTVVFDWFGRYFEAAVGYWRSTCASEQVRRVGSLNKAHLPATINRSSAEAGLPMPESRGAPASREL